MGKWLVKSDPEAYSFQDLKRDRKTAWTGVRNALAQRHLREMKKGDPVMVYHSGKDKAIIGLAEVTREPYPDATDEAGKAMCVDLKYVETLGSPIALSEIKGDARLKDFALVRMSRLSVMPVSEVQWRIIVGMKQD